MKILHLMMNDAAASGVVTFVKELCRALDEFSVESLGFRVENEILTEEDLLPETIDADIVHIHGLWRPFFHKVAKRAREAGVPIVWSTHGMTAPWSMAHKKWKKLIAWWLYQKWDLKCAAVIHSTTEQEREWNEALGFKRHVIAPLGTHLPKLEVKSRSVECRTLLFVGRVYPVKALDNLIRAFELANVSGWTLRIVGPDQAGHMAELKQIAGSNVEFVGPKYDDELAAEYDNCDILALVSHTENFGATVVDAMAHGKPVITGTKTPWKIVADEGCGWWVDNDVESLTKSLCTILNTPASTLEEMGKRGRKLVEEKYTWPAVARTMLATYKEVCHES